MRSKKSLKDNIKQFNKQEQHTKHTSLEQELQTKMNTMAPNEKEMIKLGKDMKNMKTNSEIIDEGIVPDPKQ